MRLAPERHVAVLILSATPVLAGCPTAAHLAEAIVMHRTALLHALGFQIRP